MKHTFTPCAGRSKGSPTTAAPRRPGPALDCVAPLAMTGCIGQPWAICSYRSFQSGFIASISATFLARDPALICFSRAIATSIVSAVSNHTSSLQP
ncbi:hypothetical protein WR25_17785 [Diploscapter pachys]|uniref:Uncharacterized protein n=1 Tax=Diploscapter pachys TaxID=2018661 RepID=A0A2A2M3W4_9BILA|nr:hypothetical protein WR25_17785 [Diploscapter pachys]